MRTKHTLYNFLINITSSFMIPILGMVKFRFFVELYGSSLNGMQLAFMQVIMFLNIFELAFSLAFRQLLYKHLAEDNKQEVLKIYNSAKKIFRLTGTIIIGLGFIMSFIVPLLVAGESNIPYYEMVLYFFVLAMPFGLSYFMMGPNFVIIADQKEYKISIWIQSIAVLRMAMILVAIYLRLPVITIFIVEGINVLGSNYIARRIALKTYPWLTEKYEGEEDPEFKKSVKYTVIQRLAITATDNTDSLIITMVLGTVSASIYGAYSSITVAVSKIANSASTATINSLGNLFNDKEKDSYSVFTEYFNLSNYLATIIAICIFIVMDQFVLLYMEGADYSYALPQFASALFAINIYYLTQRESIIITRDANGLFRLAKNNAYLSIAVKIILSVVLLANFGVVGVLLATTISYWGVDFFFNPILVYKNVFNLNPLRYYKMIGIRIVIALGVGALFYCGWNMASSFTGISTTHFVIGCLIMGTGVTVVVTVAYAIAFKSFRNLIKRFYYLLFKRQRV